MNALQADRCQLVLVDYQARLLPALHDSSRVLAEALLLADVAEMLGVPVLGTEQNPDGLGPNVQALRQRCAVTLPKMHFDACEDGLLQALGPADDARTELVLAGCEAHVCLLQTVLGLRRAGRNVWVVAPACGSRNPADHALALQRMAAAGVMLVSTEMVIFEWLHHCRHPLFRQVLTRLKAR